MKKIYSIIIALMVTLAVSAQSTREYVDLGLPSGTLWATCNVGANKPEEYGDYFAWGETVTKEAYGNGNYKWYETENTTITKYCTDSRQGTVDNKTEILSEDDAATANWGSDWCMPSLDQINELCNSDYTTIEWIVQDEVNRFNGCLITSKKNDNTLFLPAAGYRYYGSLCEGCGGYWSRSLSMDSSNSAYRLNILVRNIGYVDDNRCFGFSVRPVRSKGGSATSVDGIADNQKAAKSRKYISDGNLVIEKGGKLYNANGIMVK